MNSASSKLTTGQIKLLCIGAGLVLFLGIAGLSIWIGTSLEKKNSETGSEINEVLTIMKDTMKTSIDPRKQGRAVAAERRMLAAEKFAFDKKYEEAHLAFKEAIEGYTVAFGASSPLTVTLLLRAGEVECQFKKWDLAESNFSNALKDMSENGSPSMRHSLEEWLIYALENENKYKEAIVILDRQFQKAEKNEQSDPAAMRSALKDLADCYAYDHQNDQAERLYARLLPLVQKRYSDASPEARKIQAAMERTRAIAQVDKKHYQDALNNFDNAAALDPADEWTSSEMAWAAFKLKQYQKVIDICQRHLASHPKSIWAFRLRGNAERQLGQFDPALVDLSKAISLDPENPSLYLYRADVFDKQGQKSRAAQDRVSAEKLGFDPEDKEDD